MARNSNKVTDTVRTAVITVLASGVVFYMLGTMKNDDADLYISSETYKYSEITHIFTDTAEPLDEPGFVAEANTADEMEVVAPSGVLTEAATESAFSEDGTVTDISETAAVVVPVIFDTEPEGVSSTPAAAVSDNVENVVYWVAGGEVWHITDKCASLARSKKILSGTVEQATASGKSRVCKRCGS